jgi:hypothetical protein
LYEIFPYNDLDCNPIKGARNKKMNAIKNAKRIRFKTLKLILVIPIKTHEKINEHINTKVIEKNLTDK